MKLDETSNIEQENSTDGPLAGDDFEAKKMELPAEFTKDVFQLTDKRYYSVLFSSVLLHVLLVIYFLMNPISNEDRIAQIQEMLAKMLTEQEELLETPFAQLDFSESKPQPDKTTKPTGTKKPAASKPAPPKKGTPKDDPVPKRPRRGRGGKSTSEIASSVGNMGVLALLTSTSSAAGGNELADILGSAGNTQTDLDEVLAGLNGVLTSASTGDGTGVGGVKGGRAEGDGGSIDGVVGGLGKATTGSFERNGDLVVVSGSPLIEGGGGNGVGGRSQEDIQVVVTKHNKSIQYCYEKQLKRSPDLKGKIVVRFTITPQGTIKNVKLISSDLNNRKVEQCVISKIRRWADFGSVEPSFGNTTIRQAYAFGY